VFDDGDWETWSEEFGWADDDLNEDCPNGAGTNHSCWADPGEWGFVYYYDINNPSNFRLYHPEDVVVQIEGGIDFLDFDTQGNPINSDLFVAVGVDEYHSFDGLNEAEMVSSGIPGASGESPLVPGLAMSPPHLVLSPMNYGDVWMQIVFRYELCQTHINTLHPDIAVIHGA
jgi:hypothetical protein